MTVEFVIGPDPVIVANGKLGDYADLTRGETVTFEFYFQTDSNLDSTYAGGGSYGGTNGNGCSYGGSNGGNYGSGVTFTVTGEPSYVRLREFTEYINGIKTEIDINGNPTFRERTPSRDPVDTHLVSIVPGDDVDKHPSLWGVIIGGDDPTRLVHANARLDIEVYILGDFGDYDSRTDVQNALEA